MADHNRVIWLDAMTLEADGLGDPHLVAGLQITYRQWLQIERILGESDSLRHMKWSLRGELPPEVVAQVREHDEADARARRAEWEVSG
jgi:hypothetical protein